MKLINKRRVPGATPDFRTPAELSPTWPYGVLFLLVVLFLWPILFSGKLPFMRDMFFDFLPQHTFAKQIFWSGHIPFWNSHSGCGKPFVADPQMAVFYPLHAVFYFFPAPIALRIYCVAHLWLAGAAMFALSRHWRMDIASALVTATSCMFSSWLIANLEFANNLAAAVWTPFILLTVSRIAQTLRAQDIAQRTLWLAKLALMLALFLAVQYLAGFPEFLVYTAVLATIYIFALCIFHRAFRALAAAILILAVASVIAILLTTPQLLLNLEFVPLSERAAKINPGLHMASLQFRELLQFVLPFINGRPGYPDQFRGGSIFEFWIGTCYVGIFPLVLAGFSILVFGRGPVARQRKFLCAFLGAATAFGICMALGRTTPLYQFLYNNVPGFDHFRFPSKFLVLVLFAVSLLAGLGWQQIQHISKSKIASRSFRKVVLICGSLVIAVFGVGYFSAVNGPWFFQALTNGRFSRSDLAYRRELHDYGLALVFLAASFAVILVLIVRRERWNRWLGPPLVFANLFFITRTLHPLIDESVCGTKPDSALPERSQLTNWRVHSVYGPVQQWLYASNDESLIKWAIGAGIGDSWLRLKIDHTWQGGQKLERYFALYHLLWSLPPEDSAKLADLISVRYALVGTPFDQICWQGASRNLQLIQRPSARPRTFLVNDWIRVPRVDDPDQATLHILQRMLAPDFDPVHTALVEPAVSGANEASIPEPITAGNGGAGEVYLGQDNVNETIVRVMVERKSLLVLNDAWYPGWVALVDGSAQPIFRTNFHFRGVFLDPGQHELRFVFAPKQFRIGIWISLLTIVLVSLLFVSIGRVTAKS